jgi:O-antigen ligase
MEKLIIILLFCYLVLFPFGQLNRLPVYLLCNNKLCLFKSPEIRLYLTDIVMFLLISSWVIWRFLLIKKKYRLPPLAKPIFLFSLIAMISLMFNSPRLSIREIFISGLYLLRWCVYAGLYFVLFDLKNHFKYLKWSNMTNFLVVIGTMTAIFGLVQYLIWPDIGFLEVFGYDPHYFRLVGTFFDPGFIGIILVLTLILIVTLNWKKIGFFKLQNLPAHCLLFTVYCSLALTYSRSSYLAYLVGMGVIAFIKRAPRFFLIILFIGALTLFLLPRRSGGEGIRLERTRTVQARVGSWRNALIISRDHPLLGVGFNAYRYAQRDYGFLKERWQESNAGAGADSSFLFVLATTGILGFFTYLWIWMKSLISNYSSVVIFSSIIAIFIHSFFLNSLFYPWVMAWIWILLAKENK